MRKAVIGATCGLLLAGGAALAQSKADAPRVYAYPGENFCPAGLRPVTIDGVISCGTPTQSLSYAAMKATPARRARSAGYAWHGGKGAAPDR